MKNTSKKILKIFSSAIILFSIWQTDIVLASSIITPQPLFNIEQMPTQPQNIPSNKIIQETQSSKKKATKKTTKKNTTTPVNKISNNNNTTKSETVNEANNTDSKTVNPNSKPTTQKNWERYITPPIIIITLILATIFKKS